MSDNILFDQESNDSEDSLGIELYFNDGDVVNSDDDGLIWKVIMRTGTWKYRPVNGKKVRKDMSIVFGHAENDNEIGFDDLIEAYEDGAIEHVTIPTSHDDKPHENTGYIRKLKKGVRNGKEVLMAGFEFTEPDIKDKALRGSIANTSAGIIPNFINNFTGKVYKYALGHVALTNNPWLNELEPFGTQLSEEDTVYSFLFDEEAAEETSVESSEENHEETSEEENEEDSATVEESENETDDENENADNESVSTDENDINKGGNDMSDSSNESVESEKTELSDDTVTETMLSELRDEFSSELKARDEENEKLRAQVHAAEVKETIEELKTNFGDFPGFLSEVKQIMLADTKGEKIIAFSEEVEGKTEDVKLSASEVVMRVIKALPTDKIKELSLSDEFTSTDDHNRPDVNLSDSERGDKLSNFLGLDLPNKEGDK